MEKIAEALPSGSGFLLGFLSMGSWGFGLGGGVERGFWGLRVERMRAFRRASFSGLRGGERRPRIFFERLSSLPLGLAYSMKVSFSFSYRSMRWIGLGRWRDSCSTWTWQGVWAFCWMDHDTLSCNRIVAISRSRIRGSCSVCVHRLCTCVCRMEKRRRFC